MNLETFVKDLSKYPKEVILQVFYTKAWFKIDDIVREVEWHDMQFRFNKLMKQTEEITKQMKVLADKKDIKSYIKYMELLEKDNEIHKKIDKVMAEMSAHHDKSYAAI